MPFPATRMRRLRQSGVLRDLVRETELDVRRLVYPMFVVLGLDRREPLAAMPAIDRLSLSAAVEEAGEAARLGTLGRGCGGPRCCWGSYCGLSARWGPRREGPGGHRRLRRRGRRPTRH